MATYYLIDAHKTPVTSSEINSVVTTSNSFVRCDGNFVIKVDDSVHIAGNPTSLSDLLTKKYQGILAKYPGFNYIVYDDCLDSSGLIPDPLNSGQVFTDKFGFSGYNTIIKTPVINLTAPTAQVILLVETAVRVWVNDSNGNPTCYYKEMPYPNSSGVMLQPVATQVTPSDLGTIVPLPYATNTIQLEFTTQENVAVTSWALIY